MVRILSTQKHTTVLKTIQNLKIGTKFQFKFLTNIKRLILTQVSLQFELKLRYQKEFRSKINHTLRKRVKVRKTESKGGWQVGSLSMSLWPSQIDFLSFRSFPLKFNWTVVKFTTFAQSASISRCSCPKKRTHI